MFTRFADSQVGHGRPVEHPGSTANLDYEGEVAIVIGSPTHRADSDEAAMAAIAGLSCFNDLSVRDWQTHSSQWTPGKNFLGIGSFGPWLVTLDEIEDYRSLELTTRLNGRTVQRAQLRDMIFDFAAIIRYVSAFTPLAPGDVIVTGTPGGVGAAATPPRFLSDGDIVEVEVTGIGTLRNRIVRLENDSRNSQ